MLRSVVLVTGLVVAISAAPLESRHKRSCNYQAAGALKHSKKLPLQCVDGTKSTGRIVCCTESNEYPDGAWIQNKGCNVFAAAWKFDAQHQDCPSGKVTYAQAESYCKDVQARLCTVEELGSNCGASAGCRNGKKYAWASDRTTEPTTTAEPVVTTTVPPVVTTTAPPVVTTTVPPVVTTTAPPVVTTTVPPVVTTTAPPVVTTTAPPVVTTTDKVMDYIELDGCCRGDGPTARQYIHYADVKDIEVCTQLCTDLAECTGIEISPWEGCEVHTGPITHGSGMEKCQCLKKVFASVVTTTVPPVVTTTVPPVVTTTVPPVVITTTAPPVVTTTAEPENAYCHMVSVGGSKYNKNNMVARCAANNEEHKVRCCSSGLDAKPHDTKGWIKSSKCGLFAASKKMASNSEPCQKSMSYTDANEHCTNANARLCTLAEMENDCTAGTGCSFSAKHIWTSSSDGEQPPATTEEPATEEPETEEPEGTEGPETEGPEPAADLVEVDGKAECQIEIKMATKAKQWSFQTNLGGFQGEGYFIWTGSNNYNVNKAHKNGLMTFTADISTPGRYVVDIRKRHENLDNTVDNDIWLNVDDQGWVKVFDGTVGEWDWETKQSWENIPGQIWSDARFYLSAGHHTIQLAARSKNLAIDALRITLNTEPIPTTQAVTTPIPRTTGSPMTMDQVELIEENGYAVARVESVPRNGWKVMTKGAPGYPNLNGTAYYKWTNNNKYKAKDAGRFGLLTFDTFVTNAGDYSVALRKFHDDPDNTIANDAFMQVDDHEWVKVFDGTVGEWDETTRESWEGRNMWLKKTDDPRWFLSAGHHTVRVSARSKGLCIDQVSITKMQINADTSP